MALQTSPSKTDIEKVLQEMKKIDDDLEKTMRIEFTDTKTGNLRASAGQIEVANKIIEMLK